MSIKPAPKAQDFLKFLLNHYVPLIQSHLQGKGNLSQLDLEYTVEKTSQMKDEKLQGCIAELIGWGDEERAEVETFFAIAVEVMKQTPPSRLRDAARIVEIKALMAGTSRVESSTT